jgi:hypothetical protein
MEHGDDDLDEEKEPFRVRDLDRDEDRDRGLEVFAIFGAIVVGVTWLLMGSACRWSGAALASSSYFNWIWGWI